MRDDPAVVVVSDVDPHLGVDLGLVCWVRCGQGGGHGTPEDQRFGDLMGNYMEDVVTMFRIIRDWDSG